jgi:PilZ domain
MMIPAHSWVEIGPRELSVKGARMRIYERHKTDAPVMVKGFDAGMDRSVTAHCVNLSEGGVGCIVSSKLKPGEFVLLELLLPVQQKVLLVSAQVRHCSRYYCGLSFVAPSVSVTSNIRTLCRIPEVALQSAAL